MPHPTSQPRDTRVGACIAPPLPDDPRVIAVERHRDQWVFVVETDRPVLGSVVFVDVYAYEREVK